MPTALALDRARRVEVAEEAVLSAILMAGAVPATVSAKLAESDFVDPRRRLLYRAMQRLHQAGKPIDPLMLEVELAHHSESEAAGGKDYVANIIDCVPSADGVAFHAGIVVEEAQRRSLIDAASRALQRAESTDRPTSAIAAEWRAALAPLEAQGRDGPRPQWYVLSDLLDNPELTAPPVATLAPIGWRGRLTLLVGREKRGGKSTTACAAVALATQQGKKVLYLSMDEPLDDTVQRLHRFGSNAENVFLMAMRPDDLGELVEKLSIDAVVIDALSHYVAKDAPESGDSAAWTRALMPIVACARKHHVAIILIQHAGKATGEYRDSTAIGANVDLIITLTERPDHSRKATILGRFSVPSFTVSLNEAGCPTFSVDDATAPADRSPAPALAQVQALRLLQSAEPEGLKAREWQRLASEAHISRTSFYRARRSLYTDGYASHQSTIYRVSPSGADWLIAQEAG